MAINTEDLLVRRGAHSSCECPLTAVVHLLVTAIPALNYEIVWRQLSPPQVLLAFCRGHTRAAVSSSDLDAVTSPPDTSETGGSPAVVTQSES
jgi:hypothetical protein